MTTQCRRVFIGFTMPCSYSAEVRPAVSLIELPNISHTERCFPLTWPVCFCHPWWQLLYYFDVNAVQHEKRAKQKACLVSMRTKFVFLLLCSVIDHKSRQTSILFLEGFDRTYTSESAPKLSFLPQNKEKLMENNLQHDVCLQLWQMCIILDSWGF